MKVRRIFREELEIRGLVLHRITAALEIHRARNGQTTAEIHSEQEKEEKEAIWVGVNWETFYFLDFIVFFFVFF